MSQSATLNRRVKDFLLYETPVGVAVATYRIKTNHHSQSNEAKILDDLLAQIEAPKTFVEFGFHAHEFNCVNLISSHRGLLIDGSERTVTLARKVLPRSIEIVAQFLTLETLSIIEDKFGQKTIGVLSIDVDGNDFWFLQKLIHLRPAVISVEYNASFGLSPITVPYDPAFVRHEKHISGWYHGASLTAVSKLCEESGYHLVAVSDDGINAFFIRSDIIPTSMPILKSEEAYRENLLRNKWSGTTQKDQWQAIKGLPYVQV